MQLTKIIPVTTPNPALSRAIFAGQIEAGRLWTDCAALHAEARKAGGKWPDRKVLQDFVKGRGYALHSQTAQMLTHQLLANVEATMARRRSEPSSREWLKLPWREKRFQALYWPAQAVSYDLIRRRLVLPMGRGRKALTFTGIEIEAKGAVKLVWNDGYELHVAIPAPEPTKTSATGRACVDLGEIHQATVATDNGEALIVSGRGIRAAKRLLNMQMGQIAEKRSRCTKGSKRWRSLQHARATLSKRAKRRVRDMRHKGARIVADFCVQHEIGSVFIGDPHGVRNRACGRKHNQRMARWEYGKDIEYLQQKLAGEGIASFTGDERGTSSRCPQCGHRHKPQGRVWSCKKCGFTGHRDIAGAVNMHQKAFDTPVTFPRLVTYRRAGLARAAERLNNAPPETSPARRRSPDPGQVAQAIRCRRETEGASSRFAGASQGAAASLRRYTEALPL
jgi:putative transposase